MKLMKITSIYQTIEEYNDNLSNDKLFKIVRLNKNLKYGVIDEEQNIIVPPIFDKIEKEEFDSVFHAYKNNNSKVIFTYDAGKVHELNATNLSLECISKEIWISGTKNKKRVINYDGKVLLNNVIEYVFMYEFKDSRNCLFEFRYNQGNRQYTALIIFTNKGFNVLKEICDYTVLLESKNQIIISGKKGAKILYLDDLEKESTLYFDEFIKGKDSSVIIRKGEYYGIIGKNGNILMNDVYDSIETCCLNQLYKVRRKSDHLYALADENANMLTGFIYSEIFDFNSKKSDYSNIDDEREVLITQAKRDGVTVVLNSFGEEIFTSCYSKLEYRQCKYFEIESDRGVFIKFYDASSNITSHDKFGFISYDGKVLLEFQYDNFQKFTRSSVKMKKGAKFGIFDLDLGIIAKCKYDEIKVNNLGRVCAYTDDYYDVTLKLGDFFKNIKIPRNNWKYNDYIQSNDENKLDKESFEILKDLGKYKVVRCSEEIKIGVIDEKFNFLIYPIYDEFVDFSENIFIFKKGAEYVYVSPERDEIYSGELSFAGKFEKGYAKVGKDGKFGIINTEGKLIISFVFEMIEMK